jgi:large subunit ribosomal protein L10
LCVYYLRHIGFGQGGPDAVHPFLFFETGDLDMGMTRAEKESEVDALKKIFDEEELIVVTHYSGLNMPDMTELRSKMHAEGANFKVTKNSLARRAMEGTRFAHMSDLFSGPTGIAFSKDEVAAARVVHDFAKSNDNLVIVGGGMGESSLDKAGVVQLAKLPSLDELRGKLVGLLQAPATKIAGVTQAPAGKLARVISARAQQG